MVDLPFVELVPNCDSRCPGNQSASNDLVGKLLFWSLIRLLNNRAWIPSSGMRADHLEKINSWFMEEIAAVKAEGGSVADFEDPAVADLALRKIFEEHFDEMRNDSGLIDETFGMVSTQASPLDLREIAEQAQKQGNLEIGHYLNLIADYREGQTT